MSASWCPCADVLAHEAAHAFVPFAHAVEVDSWRPIINLSMVCHHRVCKMSCCSSCGCCLGVNLGTADVVP